jgi:hypothetical protein
MHVCVRKRNIQAGEGLHQIEAHVKVQLCRGMPRCDRSVTYRGHHSGVKRKRINGGLLVRLALNDIHTQWRATLLQSQLLLVVSACDRSDIKREHANNQDTHLYHR